MTNMPLSRDSPEELERQSKSVPFLRFAEPREMAYTIAYLCSPEADFITGQVGEPKRWFHDLTRPRTNGHTDPRGMICRKY